MRSGMHTSWPFTAGLVDSVTAAASVQGRCGFRCVNEINTDSGLLGYSCRSHRRSGRPLAGSMVGGAVLVDADVEQVRQGAGIGVGEPDVGAFDAAQCGGGDLGGRGQLGLGEAFDDAPVAGVALIGGDSDDLLDRDFEDLGHSGQQVDLWRSAASFPGMDGRLADVGEAGEVGDADLAPAARVGEGLRIESAQYTTCHAGSAARFIVRQIHRVLHFPVNAAVINGCLSLEWVLSKTGMLRRDSVKLPRVLSQRPTPRMPLLAGFEPRFDPIPAPHGAGLDQVFRPLYWWAQDLRARGDVLQDLRFDAPQMTATVTVRLASSRVITVVRGHDDKPRLPHDVPTLLAEAVWRLGALGWACDLVAVVDLLRGCGLLTPARPARRCTDLLPGWVQQPDRSVRVALWWALALRERGWQLSACGDAVAGHGFIAEIPGVDGDQVLAIYPGDMADDGTEASALANHLARLTSGQRKLVAAVLTGPDAGQDQVI